MNPESKSKVVVTGIGLVTPLGLNRRSTWGGIRAGKSGIKKYEDGIFAKVFGISPNGSRSRMGDMALVAADEALRQAGLTQRRKNLNIGTAVSQSKPVLQEGHHPTPSTGLTPDMILGAFRGWTAEQIIRKDLDCLGPSGNVVAACATSVGSLGLAKQWIENGITDIVLAGGTESSFHPLYVSGFRNLGVLSKGNSPEAVCPFDRHRSGFAMGEGAGFLVLESAVSAKKRDAEPLAVLESVRMAQHPGGAVDFGPDSTPIAKMIRSHPIPKGQVGYVNAHGTGTRANDLLEANAIRESLDPSEFNYLVSSTKAATGHLLGAAGAVEASLCVLALENQFVPGTCHLKELDPDFSIPTVKSGGEPRDLDWALSLSFGFGGQMGSVLFSRGAEKK